MATDLFNDFLHPFDALPFSVLSLRLIAAMVLGGAIGWEREMHQKSAGFRTHLLMALAACLVTLLGFDIIAGATQQAAADGLRADPLRIINAVTAGLGFLAAGVIIHGSGTVHGLTTGASMWLSGAIGMVCGAGRLPLAILATVMVLIVLWLLRKTEHLRGNGN
ncbi:MgtC/SapB family protein [Nioella nitratireducens]|uniref:MgtC/SapB family protein n=1 Tax=Nioella nitratireducens TaxID=1287720 RepID=UPI0008FD551C|nr:MgtC/SapB family protein [Nioella nitratireducens]